MHESEMQPPPPAPRNSAPPAVNAPRPPSAAKGGELARQFPDWDPVPTGRHNPYVPDE
jgi:hypothetical protein